MRRYLVSFLCLSLVLSASLHLAPASAAPVSLERWLVVPGQKIGPIYVGMPMVTALETMRAFGPVDQKEGDSLWCVDKVICVAPDPLLQTEIWMVGAFVPRAQDAQGNRVGGPVSGWISELGKPESIEQDGSLVAFEWASRGVALFVRLLDNVVVGVVVFRPD